MRFHDSMVVSSRYTLVCRLNWTKTNATVQSVVRPADSEHATPAKISIEYRMLLPEDLEVSTLGRATFPSPLELSAIQSDGLGNFVPLDAKIRYQLDPSPGAEGQELAFHRAGPRQQIFFDSPRISAAMVTCGGLCPGLNNVIRSCYLELRYNYGVERILGVRHGYMGLNPASGLPLVELTNDDVEEIHKLGGTVLGTSRGAHKSNVIVDRLQKEKVDILLCVGGDGTLRGANSIYREVARRGLQLAVVVVPKTIDNDIRYVYRTFGYSTAVEVAQDALRCAHIEAKSTVNGIGLVKLMGRHAGFIAAGAALASQDANFVLVPEIEFPLDEFLTTLHKRIDSRGHALIAVAEGAGRHLFGQVADQGSDASGNVKLDDIGLFLKRHIEAYFRDRQQRITLKYIDPSYLIRSVPANAQDRILSNQLARFAVHAAMAGRTNVLMGLWNNCFVEVPLETAMRTSKRMDVEGDLWTSVILSTGQPRWPAASTEHDS